MMDEKILVIKRERFFPTQVVKNGLIREDLSQYLEIIDRHKEFMPRASMEGDPAFKQVIPYLIFTYNGLFFLMQRAGSASEQRLANKYSLGIGGHIRQEDMQGDSIFAWAEREFHEEVNYAGALKIEPLGLLNDDSNEVGRVHVGLVLLLHGDSPEISVRSELKSGRLAPLEECAQYEGLENWSKILVDYLISLHTAGYVGKESSCCRS